jgi:uncharacterized membrane protein
MLLLRILHIVAGVLWVGMAVFTAYFLMPAMAEAGPDAAKVMAGLQRRRILTVIPALGLVTIVAGLWMLWKASLGLQHDYLVSPAGHTFTVGGGVAIVGFILGVGVMRPAMLKAAALMQSMGELKTDAERQARMAEIGRLRARAGTVGRFVGALLVLAAAAMAVARYL